MNEEIVTKNGCVIKFYSSFNELDNLPQDKIVVVKNKDEILKLLGLSNVKSKSESVFLELSDIKVLDNGRS